MAEYFVSQGKKVIIAGRTESTLQKSAKKLGHSTACYVLDTSSTSSIPFAKQVISDHPEVNCLINNAGVQRPLNVQDFDLEKAD
jgi:short-subunit dehydrogenase involved in D-alanine esterification of teichoic acids